MFSQLLFSRQSLRALLTTSLIHEPGDNFVHIVKVIIPDLRCFFIGIEYIIEFRLLQLLDFEFLL